MACCCTTTRCASGERNRFSVGGWAVGLLTASRRIGGIASKLEFRPTVCNVVPAPVRWGKAVPIPPVPVYPPQGNSAAAVAAAAALPSRMTTIRTKPEPPWAGGSCIGGGPGDGGPRGSSFGGGGFPGVGGGGGGGGPGGISDALPWSTGQGRGVEVHAGSGADIEVKAPSDLRLRCVRRPWVVMGAVFCVSSQLPPR